MTASVFVGDPLVVAFGHPAATDPRFTGGKGASLARLTAAGLNVPPGFVVTAAAYRAFVAGVPELGPLVAELAPSEPELLVRQCEAIRSLLESAPLPEPVRAGVLAALPGAASGDAAVSVRSSATLEDTAGAAYAGQHDTYLDVRGESEVLGAVRRCFASLWEDRAVRYRFEQGHAPDAADMAVVVQRMVASEVAGVAFTMNPITGDLSQVVVNAAYGLGETVVSGAGDVDQSVLDKATGRVVAQMTGEKTHALLSTPEGTRRVEVEPERRMLPSLDPERLRELAALATRVELFYSFPQDIEWALAEGRLWLLQSRPVTRFPARWSRDESAERFPNPVTPLTWDFTTLGFHQSLSHSLELMGLPPFDGRWFERFGGYVYGNDTAVRLFASGQQVQFGSLDALREMVPVLRDRYRWVQELPVTWARDLDRYLLALGRFSAVDMSALDERALWRHVLDVDALGRSYFLPNIAISITQGVLHRMLYRLLELVAGPQTAPQLYDGLTGFCETKTNLVNRDLHRLYLLAREDRALSEKLRQVDRERLWKSGGLDEHPAFVTAFHRFLSDHGHREVDFDAYQPTWSGQPWVVLENLRLMLLRGDVPDPAEREAELRARQAQAERDFLAAVPADLRNFAGELVRLTRAYTALDDLEHYQTTRLSVPFRSALVELGRRMVGRGMLDRPAEIFFLRRETLDALFAGDADAGRSIGATATASTGPAAAATTATPSPAEVLGEARSARTAYEEQQRTPPPHVYGEAVEQAAAEGDLRGMPGSPGIAEGPVCLVNGVEDFSRFRPGSVLVARTTNPAWTPLFYSAAAVVTESGGPLSHGAVTAREVGVPAVMAVRGALGALRDGERVRVNGTQGVVTRL